MKKVIALIDCDSFFVSCEQATNPELQNKPVCVIGNERGCVLSRSKEAKEVGIPMGMPYFMAKKEFPSIIYVNSDKNKYRDFSKKIMDIIKRFSPDVEVISIDEAFIDITGTQKYYQKNYIKIVNSIKDTIFKETQIPVSIGLSTSKTLAKLASDKAKKTGGLYVIGSAKLKKVLKTTPVEDVCGIGRNLSSKLKRWGLFKCVDFTNKSDEWIKKEFGINGVELKHELLGECLSKVDSATHNPKSIQDTSAIGDFTSDLTIIKNEINKHIHKACSKLRKYNGTTSMIGVMLRTKDFRIFYRRKKLLNPTNFELEISKELLNLLNEIYDKNILYRSTGVILEKIEYLNGRQQTLFIDEKLEKNLSLSSAIDNIEKKYGKNIIKTGFWE